MDVSYEMEWVVFFFKQKTAYEMLRSLVGSEMCIRDRHADVLFPWRIRAWGRRDGAGAHGAGRVGEHGERCLLYTSDAADDLLCVDLGGSRSIKKKKPKVNEETR